MNINDKQVAGNHYKSKGYQPWDFICDIELHYLLACAVKYVCRWRDKNGVQDLHKSVHYLEKANERKIVTSLNSPLGTVDNFVKQLPEEDARIVINIVLGNYNVAIKLITKLVQQQDEKNCWCISGRKHCRFYY